MEASSQSGQPSVANAVLEFATTVGALQAAGDDITPAVTQARAIALRMPLDEYVALEEKCNAQLVPMYQHLRKYGATLENSIIVMQIGASKVGVTVPADKNRGIVMSASSGAHTYSGAHVSARSADASARSADASARPAGARTCPDTHTNSTQVRYEVTVVTSKIGGCTSAIFEGQSKVARFIAALARDAGAVSK